MKIFQFRSATMAFAAVLLTLGGALAQAAETTDRAALEKQLGDARSRLETAARDVAELSHQLYGDDVNGAMPYMHELTPRGAMLGVMLGGDAPRSDGAQIGSVSPGGPAEAAGLRAGDVIVAVDGKALKQVGELTPGRQLVEYMRGVKAGQAVKVEYLRSGRRQTATVTAVAAEPPMMRMLREGRMLPPMGPMTPDGPMPPFFNQWFGPGRAFGSLELVDVTPKLGQYFGTEKGLLVVRAPAEGGLGLQDGDVILSIGGREPENPGHAFRILRSYQPSEKFKIDILRNRKRMTLDAAVPDDGAMRGPGRPPAGVVPGSPPPPPPAPAPPPPKSGAA